MNEPDVKVKPPEITARKVDEKMEVAYVSLTEITPYVRNPRNNTNAISVVAESIRRFGFKQPLVLDEDMVIIVGHTRYLAAKSLGLKQVPCVIERHYSDAQKKAYRLADNKSHEFSTWDFNLLTGELAELTDFNMDAFGFEFPMGKATATIDEVEIRPYHKVHYLVTIDVSSHDKIIDGIEALKKIDGCEIVSTNN